MKIADISLLNTNSLRKQVYEYIKGELNSGRLKPGDPIDQKQLAAALGISKTPLRDSLISLEAEGFVQIIPCKGVIVKRLSTEEVRNLYSIGGALEREAIELAGENLGPEDLAKMQALIEDAEAAIASEDFDRCPELNEAFHDVVLEKCGNEHLVSILRNVRARLYDFPKREIGMLPHWEKHYWMEHREFLSLLASGRIREAGEYMKNVHWSFEKYRKEIEILYEDFSQEEAEEA